MERTLQMVEKEPVTHTDSTQQWNERPLSPRELFCGQDETGRRGWFLRLEITGLYPRRVGPFPTRTDALECVETFLARSSSNRCSISRTSCPGQAGAA